MARCGMQACLYLFRFLHLHLHLHSHYAAKVDEAVSGGGEKKKIYLLKK